MKRLTLNSYLFDLSVIVGVWAIFLLVIDLIHRFGGGVSVEIASMGEDNNWIELLGLNSASATARHFWQIDSRNPLSPWIYLIVRPFILNFATSLTVIQWLVELTLALSTYLLMRIALGKDIRWFAVATASGIAINFSNAYFDHIIWSCQVALCCSLLSVVAYSHFLKTENSRVGFYGLSLVLWAIAFQLYTVQSGAIVAIMFCHLRFWWKKRPILPVNVWQSVPRYVGSALKDLLPFALIYVLFQMVWTTTSIAAGESFRLAFSADRFLSSLRQGVFHSDTPLMVEILWISLNAYVYLFIAAIFAVATTGMLNLVFGQAVCASNSRADYAFLILLMAAIALPTIILESGGEGWPPGSRWRMIYQVTSPVLAMSATMIVLSCNRWLQQRANIVFAIFMFFWVTCSLAFNERQAQLTHSEALVRSAIRQVLESRAGLSPSRPLLAVIELNESFRWFAGETLQGVYMRTWFPGADVEMRFLPSPTYRALARTDQLSFTQAGVEWKDGKLKRAFSYYDVAVFQASNSQVLIQKTLLRSDVVKHNGDWRINADKLELDRILP
jgi:hypothetical protein